MEALTAGRMSVNGATLSLAILCTASLLTGVDRAAFPLLIEPIRLELALTDTHIGLLTGFAYTAVYAAAAIPIARWADVGNRRAIIVLSTAVWSVMTALCGLAQSTWQLFIARFGVGFGEAGSTTPAQSLIADYYPPERRALPLALFAFGVTSGAMVGSVLVGFLAQELGWRGTLLIVGLPGVVSVLLIHAFVAEPRRDVPAVSECEAVAQPALAAVLASLAGKRTCVHVAIGFALWGFAAYGIHPWLPAFLMRTHGVTLSEAGILLGGYAGASSVGLLLSGFLGNRMLARDLRWGLWLPAGGVLAYAILLIAGLLVPSLHWSAVLLVASAAIGGLVAAPILAVLSGLVLPNMRAVALASLSLLAALFGGGVGPLSVGAFSEWLTATAHADSLRYALSLSVAPMLWGALHLFLGSKHLLADFEDNRAQHLLRPPESAGFPA